MKRVLSGLALLCGLMGGAANAASVVKVQLGDAADDMSMAMKLDANTAKAGSVEFDVTNLSKTKIHEMIVVAVGSTSETLAYDDKNNAVDEERIKDLGEASDLDPGTKKTLTLDLKPGLYRLICNQPGHYRHGMKADFTVTP